MLKHKNCLRIPLLCKSHCDLNEKLFNQTNNTTLHDYRNVAFLHREILYAWLYAYPTAWTKENRLLLHCTHSELCPCMYCLNRVKYLLYHSIANKNLKINLHSVNIYIRYYFLLPAFAIFKKINCLKKCYHW